MGRLPVRRAARVILLDPDDRVLLMRYDDGPPNGRHWSTPGGGLNAGEAYRAAAARELAEETGWNDVALLGEVQRRSFDMEYAGQVVRQRERLYLARIARLAARSGASRRCTPPMALPPGAGGRLPALIRRPKWCGPPGWPA